MTKLDQLFQQIHTEIGMELVSTDVVGMDGLAIASIATDPRYESSMASAAARFAMVMKLAGKVADKLEIGTLDDNLVTTDTSYILTRALGDGSYYWGVTVTREAVLGNVRMIMSEYAAQVWDAIPH
jgi:predicted regulator of Ras-like GTPase activity (Roadblock/LC7/MglB family)